MALDIARVLPRAIIDGLLAAAATAAMAAVRGEKETGNGLVPINAVSHIIHGEKAAFQRGYSRTYTLCGLALHACACTTWAVFNRLFFLRPGRTGSTTKALAAGAATSIIAYTVDYHVVPKRLTPGFELRLSNKSLGAIYVTLALGLAAGALIQRRG